jgi:hypothetical protein
VVTLVTDSEFAEIRERAEEAELSLSGFVHEVLLAGLGRPSSLARAAVRDPTAQAPSGHNRGDTE